MKNSDNDNYTGFTSGVDATEMDANMFADTIDAIVDGNVPDGMDAAGEEYIHGNATEHLKAYAHFDSEKAFARFKAEVTPARRWTMRHVWTGMSVAAAIAALVVVVRWHKHEMGEEEARVETTSPANLSQHQTDGKPVPVLSQCVPTITLANGKVINLNDDLIEAEGMSIETGRSSIAIAANAADIQQLTLNIPRGRQYEMTLSDGTHVWLNSDTRFTFPSRFDGKRTVALRGQAYFDVTHTGEPFSVNCSRGTVNVMGTSFDVCDYSGEDTRVTLESGKVSFDEGGNIHVLQPGQQAVQHSANAAAEVRDVDVRTYTAWKDGIIYFYDESLENIMNEIERIYDVNVTFADAGMKNFTFTAECSRYESVDDFLKLLSMTGVFRYVRKGRQVKLLY